MKIVTSQNVQERGCQLSLQFSWPVKDVHEYLSRRGVVVRLSPEHSKSKFYHHQIYTHFIVSILVF